MVSNILFFFLFPLDTDGVGAENPRLGGNFPDDVRPSQITFHRGLPRTQSVFDLHGGCGEIRYDHNRDKNFQYVTISSQMNTPMIPTPRTIPMICFHI
jgi:hypothetical protein|tara:strand:+ start:785 stop:1078 length:294 start_codon:yes stop_codon:yes gene_type:complete